MNSNIYLDENYSFESIVEIIKVEGWKSYLVDIKLLRVAFEKSLSVMFIKKEHEVIGFIRLLGDGIHTLVIQDMVIIKEEREKGYGSKVLNQIISKYNMVRQKILICDNSEELIKFYEGNGFRKMKEYGIECLGIM